MKGEDIDVDFKKVEGFIGTHSIQHFLCNKGRGGGLNRDETDHHGRLKSRHHQSNTYADTTIPFVDKKVASVLCTGRAVTYLV